MKSLRFAFSLILLLALTSRTVPADSTEECHEAIRSHFLSQNPKAASEFFQLQAKLTLHRMAHAHLKAVAEKSPKSKAEMPRIETTIRETVQRIQTGSDPAFEVARAQFLKAPLSRRAIHEVLEGLKDVLKTQAKSDSESRPFHLHVEDIKLLGVLAEVETNVSAKSSLFVKSRNDPRSVLHLVKLVNSAYQGRSASEAAMESELVARQIQTLEARRDQYADAALRILKENPACRNEAPCEDCSEKEASRSQASELLVSLLRQSLIDNDYEGVRYNDVWLRTSKAPVVTASSASGGPPGEKPSSGTPSSSTRSEPAPVKPAPAGKATPPPAKAPETPTATRATPSPAKPGSRPKPETARLPRLKLDLSNTGTDPVENKKSPLTPRAADAITDALKQMGQLAPCLEKAHPEALTPAHIRAAALLAAERKRSIMAGSGDNFLSFFKPAKKFKGNPYRTGSRDCPVLNQLKGDERESALELLGAFDFWSSRPASSGELNSCSTLPADEKLFLHAVFRLGITSPSGFKDCKIPESSAYGMGVYRRFLKGIR